MTILIDVKTKSSSFFSVELKNLEFGFKMLKNTSLKDCM